MSGMTLKLKRIEARLTQQELAEKVGINKRTICAWESNIDPANVGKLKRVADVLGCTLDELAS